MVLWISPETFRGTEENEVFPANKPFEMTIARADEVQSNVKKNYGVDLKFRRFEPPSDDKENGEDKEDPKDSDGEGEEKE